MKKIILPFLCFFISAAAYGDDYTTTTILNNPVGVFDNLTVSGASDLGTVEIGARAKNATTPLSQAQKLTVYGTTDLLPSDGTKIDVGGSLYLLGSDGTQYSFNNIYIFKNSLLYLSSGTSGTSLVADQVDAKTFKTFSSFTEGSTVGSESVLTLSSGTPFRVGILKFSDGTNLKILDSPRRYGSKGVWAVLEGGDSADSYGPWSDLIAPGSEPADTCYVSGSTGDYIGEFVCPSTYKHGANNAPASCTDVRLSGVAREYYSTNGGIYFSQARGRKECIYTNAKKCEWASSYDFKDLSGSPAPSNTCPFSSAEVQSVISAGDSGRGLGYLCYILCSNGECLGSGSACTMTDDNLFPLYSGQTMSDGSKQPGVSGCQGSGWPVGSGLECLNAWQEKSVRVLHCGAGSGKKYPSGNFYQSRTVVCGTGGSNAAAPGTFLTLDYDRAGGSGGGGGGGGGACTPTGSCGSTSSSIWVTAECACRCCSSGTASLNSSGLAQCSTGPAPYQCAT